MAVSKVVRAAEALVEAADAYEALPMTIKTLAGAMFLQPGVMRAEAAQLLELTAAVVDAANIPADDE